jgi:hypothetical protein
MQDTEKSAGCCRFRFRACKVAEKVPGTQHWEMGAPVIESCHKCLKNKKASPSTKTYSQESRWCIIIIIIIIIIVIGSTGV